MLSWVVNKPEEYLHSSTPNIQLEKCGAIEKVCVRGLPYYSQLLTRIGTVAAREVTDQPSWRYYPVGGRFSRGSSSPARNARPRNARPQSGLCRARGLPEPQRTSTVCRSNKEVPHMHPRHRQKQQQQQQISQESTRDPSALCTRRDQQFHDHGRPGCYHCHYDTHLYKISLYGGKPSACQGYDSDFLNDISFPFHFHSGIARSAGSTSDVGCMQRRSWATGTQRVFGIRAPGVPLRGTHLAATSSATPITDHNNDRYMLSAERSRNDLLDSTFEEEARDVQQAFSRIEELGVERWLQSQRYPRPLVERHSHRGDQ